MIQCSNKQISGQLKALNNEIVHLAKLSHVDFDSTNDNYEFNSFKVKISDECEIFIKFEVKFSIFKYYICYFFIF